jgi:hypothetical protein
MPRTREQIREARRQAREAYGELLDATAALLYRHDPVGIAFDNPNADEYAPEAETILPRLAGCNSTDDLLQVVHEEFSRWFGADTAGPRESYNEIASELWQLWRAHSDKLNAS